MAHKPETHRERITEKQQAFIERYVAHPEEGCGKAAIYAGYDKTSGGRLLAHPAISAEIEKRRAVLRDETNYDVKAAMRELEIGIEISRGKGQMMAYMKGVELRSKLMGLLVEKLDVRQMTNFRINILGLGDQQQVNMGLAEPLAINPSREIVETVAFVDDKQFEETSPAAPKVEEKVEDLFGI